MEKKKVLIELDFVLRDWVNALENIYILRIGDLVTKIEDLEKIWDYFPFPNYIELEKESESDPEIMERIMAEDKKSPWKPDRKIFNEFVLDNILEIYGHAKEAVPNAIAHINKLQQENPDWEITLYSTSKSKAIPATLFFLSKSGCEIKNIKFINNWLDVDLEYQTGIVQFWDVVITSNPDFYPITKNRFYLVNTQFNSIPNSIFDPYRINSIKEVISFT